MTYTPEEIEQHRQEWLDALRSGKYKQTTGVLAQTSGGGGGGEYGYCCLGVACEISGVVQSTLARSFDPTRTRKVYGENEADLTLPEEVREWLGVDTDSPVLASYVLVETSDGETEEDSLTVLNDDYGFTFAQIADAIEKNGLA